jgi:hypothetical protein
LRQLHLLGSTSEVLQISHFQEVTELFHFHKDYSRD